MKTLIQDLPEAHDDHLVEAVLSEIATLLDALIEAGASGAIDLRALPMTDPQRERLRSLLGHGEVTANIESAGQSRIEETLVPAVWWVRHEGDGGAVAAETIAITRMPDILITHTDDMARAPSLLATLRDEARKGPEK